MPCSPRTDRRTDTHESEYRGHPFRVSGIFPSTYHQGAVQLKNLKNQFLDTNSINIYAKWQVSMLNGVARIEVRNTHTYLQANKRTPTDFTQTYGLRFVSNLDSGD